jgi:hypothetical protein
MGRFGEMVVFSVLIIVVILVCGLVIPLCHVVGQGVFGLTHLHLSTQRSRLFHTSSLNIFNQCIE